MDEDDTSSENSSLSWLWVIESLASFKEVNMSLLHGLIEMAPELPGDLGKNAREMVALRCLEGLYGVSNGIRNDIPSVLDSKVELDLSESCEDILHRILHEISESDLRMAGPGLLKWDIHSFIMQKRACMPKTELQQLKDAILEGGDPCADSLKEMSGLAFTNECDRNPADESEHNGLTWKLNRNNTGAQNMEAKENLIPLGIENQNKLAQESRKRNLLPSKRDRTDLATENLVGHAFENQNSINDYDDHNLNAKMHKQYASCNVHSGQLNPVPLNGRELLEDSSERAVQVIEREGSDLAKERKGNLEEGRVSEDGQGEYNAPKRCRQSGDVGDDEFHQSEIPCIINMMPQDKSRDEYHQNISVKDDSGHCAEPRTLSGAPPDGTQHKISATESIGNYEHGVQLKAPNVAYADRSLQKVIINEPKDDIDTCCEAETSTDNDRYHNETVDVARKKHEFLSSQCSHDSSATADWNGQNLCMKCNEGGQLLVCNTSGCPLVVHKNCLGSSASFDNGGNFYCPFCTYSLAISEYLEAKKKASVARKDLAAFIHMGLEHRPKTLIEKLHGEELNHSIQNGDENLHVKIQDDGHLGDREGNEVNHAGEYINEVLQQPITDPPEEPVCALNIDGDESSDDENHKSIISNYSIRIRRQEKHYVYPATPQFRRKKVLWTTEEEEILKEGVQRFSSVDDRSIPWKKILEFGGHVFLYGRTPIDLKDKWRNICKGSPKPK